MLPFRTDHTSRELITCGDLRAKALMWPGHVIKRLEKQDSALHMRMIFTEFLRLAPKWREGLAQGQIQTLNQGCAHRKATRNHVLGATEDARA